VRGGKYYFSVAKYDPSSKVNRKSPNYQSKKVNGVERKNIRRPNNFKSDDWYEKAALSTAISTKL
jgi:DNA/RNA endonuclease G (NUC1)